MDAAYELSIDLQECGGGIVQHERVIRGWLVRAGSPLTDDEKSYAMRDAFGMSFEADEALNKVHLKMFGKIIHE